MDHNDQTIAFLQRLGGDTFVFQTFDDSEKKRRALSRALIGTFEQHEAELLRLNSQGAGIFVQTNAGDKRGKNHITRIRNLFVDLDHPETAQESIAAIKKYMPKPTVITESSKGKYHIYWKVLDCPLDKFKMMQMQLAIIFNADTTMINLDRVMRLPGFMHNKGTPFLTKSVIFDNMHTIESIYKAASKAPILTPTVIESSPTNNAGNALKKDAFGLNLGSDYEVPNELVHGEKSRTQGLFAYGCHIMGKSESLETIIKKVREYNTQKCKPPLTEDELEMEVFPGIRKFTAERDAQAPKAKSPVPVVPQVPTAPGEVPQVPTAPVEIRVVSVGDYIDRYIYISDGMRVIDTEGKGQYRVYKEIEFRKAKQGELLNKKELAKTWLEHEHRITCRGMVWEPGKGTISYEDTFPFYNTYQPADIKPMSDEEYDPTIADQFLVHFEYMFPEKAAFEHFMNWFAHTVRYPGIHIPWAPLIISDDEGTGKGLMYQILAMLVGIENAGTIQVSDIEGNFNDFLIGKSVILIDEMSKPKSQSTIDRLKLYIANNRVTINIKGITAREHNIYGNIIIFSNNSDAAFMGAGDRRYWVHKMHTLAASAHFDTIGALFSNQVGDEFVYFDDNIRHFLTWVHKRDLSKFNYRNRPPTTDSKREMIEDSRSLIDVDLNDKIDHRVGIFAADIVAFPLILDSLEHISDRKLNSYEVAEVRKILNKRGSSIFSKSPVKPLKEAENVEAKQYRIRCIRNFDHWKKQGPDSIRHELTRSLQMAVTGNNVLDPQFNLVEGDRNAK